MFAVLLTTVIVGAGSFFFLYQCFFGNDEMSTEEIYSKDEDIDVDEEDSIYLFIFFFFFFFKKRRRTKRIPIKNIIWVRLNPSLIK